MQCFMVGAANDQVRTAFAALSQELGFPFAISADLANLRSDNQFTQASQSLVLIPETAQAPLNVTEAIGFAKEQNGRAFVICLADTMPPGDYKRLVRTGFAEWITWRDHDEEFRDLVARLNVAVSSERAAKILSFVPSKGGVGNTTLLVEVAVHLSTRRKRGGSRVAILDLNLQGGTVADALDIEPRFDVAEIVDRPERLDEQLVDIFTSRHSKSLDVFASPMSRIGIDSIKPDIVFAFIDSIASRYDAILFDLPAQWLPWTDNVLRGSDAVIVCGGESVPALRKLAGTLNYIDGLTIPDRKISAVVNAVETDLLGRVSRRSVIERALATRRTFFIRRDSGSIGGALDVGRPLLELVPHSRIAGDFRRVAEWTETMTELSPSPHPKPMQLGRATA